MYPRTRRTSIHENADRCTLGPGERIGPELECAVRRLGRAGRADDKHQQRQREQEGSERREPAPREMSICMVATMIDQFVPIYDSMAMNERSGVAAKWRNKHDVSYIMSAR